MSETNEPLAVSVQLLGSPGLPEEEMDATTRRLLSELRESGVSAQLVSQPGVQSGTKGGEWLAIGSLLMHVLPSAAPYVSGIFKGWLDKDKDREVSLELPNGAKFNLKGSMPMSDIERLVTSLSTAGAASKPAS